MKKRFKKKRGPVRAKKVTFDGITFASGLEKYMYIALKKAKIKSKYEGQTYIIQEGFEFNNESYERQANGKGEMVNRGSKKILPIKYTPDFISDSFIIECKGRANESFPIRWKMFKKYVKVNLKHVTLYKPQNQKECDEVINLILNR
jgi:YHS domain-containing protein